VTIPLIAALGHAIMKLALGVVAVFLILLVLVQRGRGGGLAGALGGMGGSSAFGAKAGDVFTRVTIVAAAVWILLCITAAKLTPSSESRLNIKTASPVSEPAISTLPDASEDAETGNTEAATKTASQGSDVAGEDQGAVSNGDSSDSSDGEAQP